MSPVITPNDVLQFADWTGQTYLAAENMLRIDQDQKIYTILRGYNDKSIPRRVRQLREAGHPPKPEFIKAKSRKYPRDIYQGFVRNPKFNPHIIFKDQPLVKESDVPRLYQTDEEGFFVDQRKPCSDAMRLDSGKRVSMRQANFGYGKPFTADVDVFLVMDRRTGFKVSQQVLDTVSMANSWYINQSFSVTHGATEHWDPDTKKGQKIQERLMLSHCFAYGEDPLVGFIGGKWWEGSFDELELACIKAARSGLI